MIINLYNTNLIKEAIIENASVIWATRYYDIGDFELYFPFDDRLYSLLGIDGFIGRDDDEHIGIIENIDITHDPEEGDYIKVTGRLAEGLLARRIIWRQTKINGNLETGIRTLVTNEVIAPEVKYGATYLKRKIDLFELGTLKNLTNTVVAQFTGTNLIEAISKMCKASALGFKVYFENAKLKFELYEGINRSYSQSENPYVVFSDEYDNLNSSNYSINTQEEYNVALVAGEGEGTARTTAVVEGDEVGRYRKEAYVDARDISSNEGEIDATEYANLLKERGTEAIVAVVESFNGEIEANTNQYVYKTDYNLGDIVVVENKKWGISINQRIIEIIESEDQEGYKLTLTFGM